NHASRGLLQAFQKGVGGAWIHAFSRVDQNHAVAIAMRAHVEEIAQRANLFNLDLLAWLFLALFNCLPFRILFWGRQGFRLNQPKIWMVSRSEPAACRTGTAG